MKFKVCIKKTYRIKDINLGHFYLRPDLIKSLCVCVCVFVHPAVCDMCELSSSGPGQVQQVHIVLKIALLRTDGPEVCGSISDWIRA